MVTFQGLTINLLRDALQQEEDINKNSRKNFPNIVWSVYDRIDVHEASSLQDFFVDSFNPHSWIGEIQSLYLFPFLSDSFESDDVHITRGIHSLFACSPSSKNSDQYTFFSIVTVDVAEKLGNQFGLHLDQYICNIRACLSSYTSKHGVVFDAFQSLGTEDIVFIFLGNRISDIIRSVYFLRSIKIQTNEKEKIDLCATTYSLLGLNLTSKTVKFEEDTEAMAQVSITLKDGKKAKDLLRALFPNKEIQDKLEIIIGEYDLQFTCRATKEFLNFYRQGGKLTARTRIYNQYILQSRTVWGVEDAGSFQKAPIIMHNSKRTNEMPSFEHSPIKDLQNKVDKLTEKLAQEKNKFDNMDRTEAPNINLIAIYQDVILILNEFIKIMSSCSHTEWLQRLENIALAFMDGIDGFFGDLLSDPSYMAIEKRSFEKKTLEINEILNDLRNALSHMHKSGEHFYNVPHPSIYYSGSAHKILMAYYNFIDLVLSLGYLKPHAENTRQSRISFFITFKMINKVQTKIYFKISAKEDRLVGFELPYAALYDFKKYIPALLHEVHHLIAPFNRAKRNEQIVHLWLYTNVYKYFQLYLKQAHSYLDDENASIEPISIKKLDANIELETRRYLANMQDDICKLFIEKLESFCAIRLKSFDVNVLDLDHIDFVCLLKRFNDDHDCYREFILRALQKIDEKNLANVKKDAPENIFKIKATPMDKVGVRARNPQNWQIMRFASEEHISTTWEVKYNNAIKEAICDVFFSDVLNLSIQDYLTYMLDVFHDNRAEWTDSFYQEMSVRIGTMIFYFFGEQGNQNLDDSISQTITKTQTWFDEQLKKSPFLDEEKRSLQKILETYKNSYITQIPLFMSLIKTETIQYALENIWDDAQTRLFAKTTKRIQILYSAFSDKELISQVRGVLSLQNAVQRDLLSPKAVQLKRVSATDDLRTLTPQSEQYFVPRTALAENLGQFLSTISAIQDLFLSQKRERAPEMTDEKKNSEREELWYRGVCNSTYGLIPSLFRTLPEQSGGNKNTKKTPGDRYHVMPYSYQVAMIRQAYMQTKTYYSILEKNETPLAVRQAFFQHYGVQTNFLDFSTNPLSALYWALNPDDESDRRKVSEAAVYVLSPEKYQKAVNTIKVHYRLLQEEETDALYPYHTQHCLGDEYVVEDMSDKHILQLKEEATEYQKNVDESDEHRFKYARMPLITVVPQKNDRILAQSGCFVAYNLLSVEEKNVDNPVDHCFDYLALENIQKEYIRICKEEGKNPERFLFKIVIPVIYQDALNRELSTIFGYSLSKMYPEIDKLLKGTSGDVKKYFKKDT